MIDSRLHKLADVLVTYSTQVRRGDRVYIAAEDIAIPFIEAVARKAVQCGAVVEPWVTLDSVSRIRLRHAEEEALAHENTIYRTVVEKADVFISAWGGWNTRARTNIDPERIRIVMRADRETRRLFSQRMGEGSLRWCGTQFPTNADAQEAGMSIEEYTDFVFRAGRLDEDDPVAAWREVEKEQERWVEYLSKKEMLRIRSRGTDLTVGIKGRKWVNCCGKANFPDGEIFTSPLEGVVDGEITFDFPGIFQGREVEGIWLRMEKGRVKEARARKGENLLHSLIETDEGSSSFGEVAIGTNNRIEKFTHNMLFDEKIGGTVHLALGDSMVEAGGKNRSSLHWDMLCDMRGGGEIAADGEIFYRDGRFMPEVL